LGHLGRGRLPGAEDGQPWITNRIKKGSFFLTTGGAPYNVRWRAVTPEGYASFISTQLEDPDKAVPVTDDKGEVIGYAYAAVEGYERLHSYAAIPNRLFAGVSD
jgi:hypothetical protein